MIFSFIAEATECDFKNELEKDKPISWLKSVSAFANGIGGTLFFGVDNDGKATGLADAQSDAEFISRRIKDRITPLPDFILTPRYENGKSVLTLEVKAGRNTPYYYSADAITTEHKKDDYSFTKQPIGRELVCNLLRPTIILLV